MGIVPLGARIDHRGKISIRSEELRQRFLSRVELGFDIRRLFGNIDGLQKLGVRKGPVRARKRNQPDVIGGLQYEDNAQAGRLRSDLHLHLTKFVSLLQGSDAVAQRGH